jgi:DNA (cytosine-5)-methyltransferase 1
MRVIWQSEIDPYASAVLRKHWPTVPNLGDVRSITAARLAAMADAKSDGCDHGQFEVEGTRPRRGEHWQAVRRGAFSPDVICGGFPCQDISNAGKRAGIDGERSGLWSEYARIIGELRPRYVIVENVAALLGRGIERVLGDLAALGFDAEWHCIPASAVGAPHRRDRVWIVAYAQCGPGRQRERASAQVGGAGREEGAAGREPSLPAAYQGAAGGARVADADHERGRLWATGREDAADAWESSRRAVAGAWESEPDVGGSLDGFPLWLDRFVGWGLTHEQSKRSVEALRGMWDADLADAVWAAIGGLDRFSQAQILFAVVREYAGDADQARLLMASQKTLTEFVRGVWRAAATSSAPRRPGSKQQRADEHPDAMQVVSRLFAHDGEASWHPGSWEDGVPRVASGVTARVDRLRCLGNAIVPQIAEIIGRAIVRAA